MNLDRRLQQLERTSHWHQPYAYYGPAVAMAGDVVSPQAAGPEQPASIVWPVPLPSVTKGVTWKRPPQTLPSRLGQGVALGRAKAPPFGYVLGSAKPAPPPAPITARGAATQTGDDDEELLEFAMCP